MDALFQDLRYAVRSLLRQPSFALTAVLTLALDIGAATAIFSVVNAVLLRPLPFERADRVVAVTSYWTEEGRRGLNVSAPDFHDWKAQSRSFSALASYSGGETSVTAGNSSGYAVAYVTAPEFFDALGLRPALGRTLSAEDHTPGSPLAAVITDAYWRRQFDASLTALGSTLRFHDRSFTIVGVLEHDARYPGRADIYGPSWIWPETESRSAHNYRAVGRLADGVTLEQAREEMTAIALRIQELHPETNEGKLNMVVPLQEIVVGDARPMLLILLGAVGLVLLIACANVANLLLARASGRAREMVVRSAVGAGRWRLMRQLLTESAALGLAGGLLGAWLARLGVLALVAFAPPGLPRASEIQVDHAALAFAIATALAASVLFGLAPALQISRVTLADGIRQGGKGSSLGAATGWARSVFVVVQVAMTVVLVMGAALLGRSLAALSAVDMGIQLDRLLVLRTEFPVASFEEAPRATAFYRDLIADLRTMPGVESAGAVTGLPTAPRSNGGYAIEGQPPPGSLVRMPQAVLTVTTPDYFRTMGIPVRSGRDFSDRDRDGSEFVAIINESLARASFPNEDPLGRRIQCGLDTLEFMTIVGVVADVRTSGPAVLPRPEIYMPYEQHPGPATALNIVVRTQAPDPLALAHPLRRRITAMHADVPVHATTMAATLERATATPRFRTLLLVLFAGVALLLALGGVYGVMAYTVSQRVPEIGVRIALGATPGGIMSLVLVQGAKLAILGMVIGVVLSLVSGHLVQDLLFGVTARDPLVLGVVTTGTALAMLAACYIPARRAVRVDPMVALRSE